MMELIVKIEAPELAASINKLADAISGHALAESTAPAVSASVAPVSPTPVAPVVAPEPVNPAPAPVAVAAPAQPVAPTSAAPGNTAAPAVPVSSAPSYTLDQISRAGASLVDAGKMQQLLELLSRYGVQAITQIQPEQYGAFATELRALGAQI